MEGGLILEPQGDLTAPARWSALVAAARKLSQVAAQHAVWLTALTGVGCLLWCLFVDSAFTPCELCRVVLGLGCLWLPLGSVAFLLLKNRCSDGLSRFALSFAASYALTSPLYALFGAAGLYVHGFQRMFYVVQVLAAGGVATYVVRNKQYWRGAEFRSAWRAIDWTLVLIIALSVFTTHRYKAAFDVLPDGSRRLIVNGDATYLSSLAYELGRQTPAAQQSVRAGIKERAYHMYPHLTAMLVARYTGQPDILDSMSRYQFLVIEVLLCLILFATVRAATGSRAAGYLAVAMTYILAIPLPPLNALVANYWYFTWHPHATSTLEPSILNSPQTYGALPVVMGALLCLMQLSLQVSRSRAGGNVAVIAGLMAAVLIRFRVQTFLIFFPGLMLLFVVLAWRQRQWRYLGAACLAVLAVGVQLVEMKLPAYYPQSASLLIHNNHLSRDCVLFNSWPGAAWVRAGLAYLLYPPVFDWTWQVLCLAVFTVLHMAGPPVAFFCGLHWFNRSTWRAPTWIFSGMIAWLTCVTIMGATCLSTPYDYWSVGGQSLFMIGWYLLPLFVIGLWQARTLLPRWTAIASPYVPAVAAMLLVSACVWQRARNHTDVQQSLHYGPVIPAPEWEAMRFIRTKLPQDAVLLTKASHHSAGACMLSGIAGRAAFMEYFCIGGPLGGGPTEQWPVREARVNRVWKAEDTPEFVRSALDTGATHLVEYATEPLAVHPSEHLEQLWSSPGGEVRVWQLNAPAELRESARLAHNRSDPLGEPYRVR